MDSPAVMGERSCIGASTVGKASNREGEGLDEVGRVRGRQLRL